MNRPKARQASKTKKPNITKINKQTAAGSKRSIASASATDSPRRLKLPPRRHWRQRRRLRPAPKNLISAYSILKSTVSLLRQNWRLFGSIALVYGLLTLIFVRGVSSTTQLGDIKDLAGELIKGKYSSLATGGILYGALLGSVAQAGSDAGAVYQSILTVLCSVVLIWSARQVMSGQKVSVRDGFYMGTYPIVQCTLVLMMVGLHLVPIAIGNWLYTTVISSGIAISPPEKIISLLTYLLLIWMSLYWITASMFAIFIATLPDMRPMRALRSAKQLVKFRRLQILKKIVFFLVVAIIVSAVIMLPVLLYATKIAEALFYCLSIIGWLVSVLYMYLLYRELLK